MKKYRHLRFLFLAIYVTAHTAHTYIEHIMRKSSEDSSDKYVYKDSFTDKDACKARNPNKCHLAKGIRTLVVQCRAPIPLKKREYSSACIDRG
jgi:hypothetical protein